MYQSHRFWSRRRAWKGPSPSVPRCASVLNWSMPTCVVTAADGVERKFKFGMSLALGGTLGVKSYQCYMSHKMAIIQEHIQIALVDDLGRMYHLPETVDRAPAADTLPYGRLSAPNLLPFPSRSPDCCMGARFLLVKVTMQESKVEIFSPNYFAPGSAATIPIS